MSVVTHWNGCPEIWLSRYLWRYSNLVWTLPWANWSNFRLDPVLGRRLGQAILQSSLSKDSILWFYTQQVIRCPSGVLTWDTAQTLRQSHFSLRWCALISTLQIFACTVGLFLYTCKKIRVYLCVYVTFSTAIRFINQLSHIWLRDSTEQAAFLRFSVLKLLWFTNKTRGKKRSYWCEYFAW